MVYDALLQGQFRDSDVTFGAGDIQRLVHESGVGITMAFDSFQLTLARNFKSPELEGGAARSQFWGGIYVMARF